MILLIKHALLRPVARLVVRVAVEPELEQLREALAGRAAVTVRRLAGDVDRHQSFSPELWNAVVELGMTRLPFAECHGGDGGSVRAYAVATMELATHCAVAALYPGTTIQVAAALIEHGSGHDDLIRQLVAGEAIAAWAFTEPATGSDPRQITTRAMPHGDSWVLTGTKQFISYAGQADVALVFARTSDTALGAFLVDTSATGWSVGPASEVLSLGGTEARPVHLDDVRVDGDRLIGPVSGGFQVMLAGEAFGKLRAAAICVGIARRALEEAAAYGLQREHRGTPIARRFPTIQAILGQAAATTLAADALILSCADQLDRAQSIAGEAAAVRIAAAAAARDATTAALHVCGAYGLTRDMAVERLYREAAFYDVAQGVAEIQQIIVARELLARANPGVTQR
jgi:alkylation response protein AidB-like acyl-CoA dehydrogenase